MALNVAPGTYDIFISGAGITTYKFTETLAGVNGAPVVDGTLYSQTSTGISAAIASLPASGGLVYLTPGTYNISTTLVVPPNVTLVGFGTAPFDWAASSNPTPTTLLTWTGSVGGTMIQFTSTSGASNSLLGGGGLRDMTLDGAGVAGIGLQLLSARHCRFMDFTIKDCTIVGIDMNVVASLSGSRDCQENYFSNYEIPLSTAAAGTQHGIRMQGDATANTSLNTFSGGRIWYKNGNGIHLLGDDNNRWYATTFNIMSGGSGHDINFAGTSSSIKSYEECFYGVVGASGGIVQGSHGDQNMVFAYTRSNGGPAPVISSGSFYWIDSEGNGANDPQENFIRAGAFSSSFSPGGFIVPNGIFQEGVPSGAVSGSAVVAADSSTHSLQASYNNGAFSQILLASQSQTVSNKTLTAASSGNSVILLNAQANLAPVTGTGADANLFTYTVLGNTVATSKDLEIFVGFSHNTGSASVTYKFSIGGTSTATYSSAATGQLIFRITIHNLGTGSAFSLSEFTPTGVATSLASGAGSFNYANNLVHAFTFNVANTDQVTPNLWLVKLVQ